MKEEAAPASPEGMRACEIPQSYGRICGYYAGHPANCLPLTPYELFCVNKGSLFVQGVYRFHSPLELKPMPPCNPGCLLPALHSGSCAQHPVEMVPLAQIRVWVLAAKNTEGRTIVYGGEHFVTRELAESELDGLPFRTAKNIRILMLESKE